MHYLARCLAYFSCIINIIKQKISSSLNNIFCIQSLKVVHLEEASDFQVVLIGSGLREDKRKHK